VQSGRRKASVEQRSSERRLQALAKANQIRSERAQLKQALAAGTIGLERVLNDPPACAQTAMLRDLLLAIPKVGPARVSRALAHCQISDTKTIAALSDRQRAALIDLLPLNGQGLVRFP
jgi:guanylate kinase